MIAREANPEYHHTIAELTKVEDEALTAIKQKKASSGKQAFYRMVFILVLPIMGQNLIDALVTSADVVMLGFVSQQSLAAVSLAGNIQFILSLFMFGLATGASMLGSQYWGKGDVRSIERVLGIALRFSLPVGALFTLTALCAPSLLMRAFTPDPVLISEGSAYLRAISPTYLFSAFTVMYLNILRSMERVKLSTAVYFVSFIANVLLNAFFIFGMQLGAIGVGIATLCARALEVIICLICAAADKQFKARVSRVFERGGVLLKDFMRYSLPAIGNDIAFGLVVRQVLI